MLSFRAPAVLALACLGLLSACGEKQGAATDTTAPALASRMNWTVPTGQPAPANCSKALVGRHATYDVGPGQKYTDLNGVPWLSLQAGDVVNIHWRAEPYRTKIGLRAQGSAADPVVINGVTNEACLRPEVSGQEAQMAADAIAEHFYANGGAGALGTILINRGYDLVGNKARHIRIQNLKVTGARSRHQFMNEEGKPTAYAKGAAGIYATVVEFLTIENCEVTGNDNGVFVNTRDEAEGLTSRHVTIRRNVIHLNGVPGSFTEHNLYVQAAQPLYEGNYIGQLMPGAKGSSLKDRSSGTVIRYNHIVAAARAIDLVETDGGTKTVGKDPDYHRAWVIGNLIESDMNKPGTSSVKLIHWGGDLNPEAFRNGTLYFVNNTVILRGNSGQVPYFSVFDMPTAQQSVQAQGNIFWMDGSSKLFMGFENGVVQLSGRNWISQGWEPGKRGEHVQVRTEGTVLEGTSPGLDGDHQPMADAPVLDQGGSPGTNMPTPAHVLNVAVQHQYVPIARTAARTMNGAAPDLGAFEGH